MTWRRGLRTASEEGASRFQPAKPREAAPGADSTAKSSPAINPPCTA